jgi:3'(2'), 5'-bisphosphate nucleotidase
MEKITRVRELAEEAGKIILEYYRSGDWTVTSKGDNSPLTQADLAANAIIVEGLAKSFSEPIISEECDLRSALGDTFWLVDPLDGTRDFVARLDTFVVCIALIQAYEPIMGVIYAPVTGESWWAEKGRGAFNNRGEKLMHPSVRKNLIAAGSRSLPSDRMQAFYDRFKITEVQRYGSAMKFCRLAEGLIDLYPRFGPTSEWDTAAGQIIAEEAGCKVIDIASGERLKYGKPTYANKGGFVASRVDLDVVSVLKNEEPFKSKILR